jgi:hypothetical protein
MRKTLPAKLFGALLLLFIPSLAFCCTQFTSFTFTDVGNCEVQLSWTFTECGVVGHYDIQYSTDGVNFGTIDQVNSTGAGSYTWTDQYAHPASYSGSFAVIYYRLVFVVSGSALTYSKQVVPNLSNTTTCSVNNTARCNGLPSLSISGPSPLCGTSGGTYTLNSSSYAVNWNLNAGSTGAVLNSLTFDGNTATVTNSGSASGTTLLLTTLIEGCDLVSLPITLGAPPPPSQMYPNPSEENVPPGSIAEFNCPGATFWPQPTNGTITAGQNSDDVAIRVANVQSGSLIVRAESSNACGTGSPLTEAFAIVPGSGQPLIVHRSFVDSAVAVEKFNPGAATATVMPLAGLYPNPATNSVQVVIPFTDYTKTFIKVFDLSGHLLKTVVPTGSSTVIDVSQQARGTYILQIFDGKQLTSQKLVRQ